MSHTAADPILICRSLTKAFLSPEPIQILKGVDLTVAPGATVAIMGRSGEGKSTLLHLLGTLDDATGGTLHIAGEQVSSANRDALRNKHIGFIFQSFHLLEHFTTLDNILMPARIARQSTHRGSAAYHKGMDLLERVGLAPRAHFNTRLLSGGEKQRVAIARALINDPDILLADEPTGNLDHTTSEQVQELLFAFTEQLNKSLIVVTHDTRLAARCGSQYRLTGGELQITNY